ILNKNSTERRTEMSNKKAKFFYHIEDLPVVMLTEKSKSHMVSGQNALISFIENPPGCVFPSHSHPAEQILIILEGEEDHICGEEGFGAWRFGGPFGLVKYLVVRRIIQKRRAL